MIKIENKENCNGCHACFAACSQKCITMLADKEGFLYPQVNAQECIRCGKCKAVCPSLTLRESRKEEKSDAYAVINRHEGVRERSSSGGVFYALASTIIKKNGVVFGATFDERKQVAHTFIDDEKDIWRLMGSKYAQSKIGDTYLQVRSFVQAEREVLFVGTPCQIAGLKAFLGREYESLLCVDIVCHGVPSPKLWDKYIRHQEKKYGAKAKKIFFRDKATGWRAYSMKIEFENGEIYQRPHEDDAFMRLFLSDVCLRPSCHNCQHKGIHRIADITLADCWGAERILGEQDDDKGISLVLTHTDKGQQALENVLSACKAKEIDINKASKENPSMIKVTVPHKDRTQFFEEFEGISFRKATKKYAPYQRSMKERLAIILKKIGIWKLIRK